MIDKELLEVLACPQNRMPLSMADAALLSRINKAIVEGRIKNQSGREIHEELEGGLLRQDGAVLYPIAADIPVLLPEEAISLSQISGRQ
jgi:uncharacterized protein